MANWKITDLLNLYLNENQLTHKSFNRGIAWLDTGTPESLLQAASFVETIEKRQGFKIACLRKLLSIIPGFLRKKLPSL